MINAFIAILVEKGLFTEAEGENLAQKIREATLPGDFKTSLRQVKGWLELIEKGQ